MKTNYLYIMGAASGVGKSTLCEGLLSQLLSQGFQPGQLAYIKPMTQCTAKQAVTVFCEQQHIAHRSIGSLVFKKGFTKNFIDGNSNNSKQLLDEIVATVSQLGENRDMVIIDGIGNPATGSVVGVSNADIAVALKASVIYVGIAGIGAAIDDTVLALRFLQYHQIDHIALIYNQVPTSEYAEIKRCVTIRLSVLFPNIPVLDFIQVSNPMDKKTKHHSAERLCQWLILK